MCLSTEAERTDKLGQDVEKSNRFASEVTSGSAPIGTPPGAVSRYRLSGGARPRDHRHRRRGRSRRGRMEPWPAGRGRVAWGQLRLLRRLPPRRRICLRVRNPGHRRAVGGMEMGCCSLSRTNRTPSCAGSTRASTRWPASPALVARTWMAGSSPRLSGTVLAHRRAS
jgi:hypothetical protein